MVQRRGQGREFAVQLSTRTRTLRTLASSSSSSIPVLLVPVPVPVVPVVPVRTGSQYRYVPVVLRVGCLHYSNQLY